MTDEPKRRVLYILSPGHSGSTLLTLLLGTHPDVATIGERHYIVTRLREPDLPRNVCVCGLRAPDCDYLQRAATAGRAPLPWYQRSVDYPEFQFFNSKRLKRAADRAARRVNFGRRFGIAGKILSAPYRNVLEANAALVDFVLESQGGKVFLDSSKSTVDFWHLHKSGLFEVVPIRLSRDGRGQFHSFMRHRPHIDEEDAAERFLDWCRRIDDVLDGWDGHPIVRVRYEDLCEKPEDELRRIASECGLDPARVSTDFRVGATHAIGNGAVVRDRTGEINLQEKWRTALTEDQLEVFDRIAGAANRALGYAA